MSILLAISVIRTDGGTQPREAVSLEVVDTYMDAMLEGAKFPPIDVFYDGTEYWLADGFHRVKAAYQSDSEEIEATIHQGTLADAQWFSFGANKSNGLYRSNADKQRAVKAALGHEKSLTLSDVQIAKHCGVSQQTVSSWRGKLESSYKVSKIETREVTRGGTTYQQNTTNIGRKPEATKPAPIVEAAEAVESYEAPVPEAPEPDTEPEPFHAPPSRHIPEVRGGRDLRANIVNLCETSRESWLNQESHKEPST